MTIVLAYHKATETTYVYRAINRKAAVKSIYIDKEDVPNPIPERVMITLEWD